MANGNVVKTVAKPKGDGAFARFGKFLRESYIETVKKSSWPTWPELRQFTAIVILAVVAASLWLAVWDGVLTSVTQRFGK